MNYNQVKLLNWIPLDKIDWWHLSGNPNAISLLEQNVDKICWPLLSYLNSNAIHLLEQHPDKIHWGYLSKNPKAIHLLERNLDKIDWWHLSENPKAIGICYLEIQMPFIY
jgi:hypothetical protein